MYDYVLSLVGILPTNLEWVYGVLVIILFLAFIILLFSPFIFIFLIPKKNKRRYF